MRQNDSAERIHWIDIARGICIIAIVIGHVFTDGYLRWCVYSFHVPAFFFLSGLCYKDGKSFKHYFESRVLTVIVPYLFYSLVSIFLFWIAGKLVSSLNDAIEGSIWRNIMDMLYGNSKPEKMRYNLPLWFLPCFFSTSMLVYGEERIVELTTKWARLFFIGICSVLGAFFSLHENIAFPWHLETAFSMSVWFILGIMCRPIIGYSLSDRKKPALAIAAPLCIMGGVLLSFMNSRIVGVRNEHYGIIPVYYLSAMITLVGIVLLCIVIGKCQLLEYLGRNTIGILVLHKFPILVFQRLIPITSKALAVPDSIKGVVAGLLVAGIAIIVSLVSVKILKLIVPWSLGMRSKRRNED